jgi:hypothetical protein
VRDFFPPGYYFRFCICYLLFDPADPDFGVSMEGTFRTIIIHVYIYIHKYIYIYMYIYICCLDDCSESEIS